MKEADIEFLSTIGRVLGSNAEKSDQYTLETLSIVSIMPSLSEGQAVERTATAILERAQLEKNLNKLNLFNNNFYRIPHNEKLVLLGLHIGNWSYSRLSRILQVSHQKIQELAWSARLKMLEPQDTYPSGPSTGTSYIDSSRVDFQSNSRCPEYLSNMPWTQAFLDEELHSKQERLFIQNHLFVCYSCQSALNRCREAYFQIDDHIRKSLSESKKQLSSFRLSQELAERLLRKYPSERKFLESFSLFMSREKMHYPFLFISIVIFLQIFQIFFFKSTLK